MTRNIGIKVPTPTEKIEENDKKNPFNGTLSIRGKLFEGKVIKDSPTYYSKFKRYARSKNSIHAHVPTNIQVKEGDTVVAAECRPLSKSVSFVVIEVKE